MFAPDWRGIPFVASSKTLYVSRDKYRLDGKTAVVKGGGRGIGFAIAQALGEAGAKVIVADILQESGRRAAEQLRADGLQVDFLPLDVR